MSSRQWRSIVFGIALCFVVSIAAAFVGNARSESAHGDGALTIGGLPVIAAARVAVEVLFDRVSGGEESSDDRRVAQSTVTVTVTQTSTKDAVASDAPRYCAEMPTIQQLLFKESFDLVRVTEEGRRLFDLVVEYDVCIDVTDIPYNGGYTQTDGSELNRWKGSKVVMDDVFMSRALSSDLAGALVHEFAHFQSFQSGTSCWLNSTCTILPNQIAVEEEVYATAAEARWWIEMYGPGGRTGQFLPANKRELVDAYERGDDYFFIWVRNQRSSPLEGEGIG